MWSPEVPTERSDRTSTFSLLRWADGLGASHVRAPSFYLLLAFAGWLSLGIAGPNTVASVLAFLATAAVTFLIVWSAHPVASPKVQVPTHFWSDPHFTTPWRLCDPTLSHWGLWRADLPRLPDDLESAHGRPLVKKYIQKLMDDWSRRSARGGSAIRIFGELSRTRGPFGGDRPGGKVYLITLLDASEVRRTGWLRLGPDWVEFQLVPDRRERNLHRGVFYETEMSSSAIPALPARSFQFDPMWDRWLDG